MSSIAELKSRFGLSNIIIPEEGPMAVQAILDFSGDDIIDIEGLLITQSEAISFIQGVYIDNADNNNSLTLTCRITRQRIIAPPNSQGYYPILITNPPDLKVETTANRGLLIFLHFYNVPIQSFNWSVLGSGGSSAIVPDFEYVQTVFNMTGGNDIIINGDAPYGFILFNPNASIIQVDMTGTNANISYLEIEPQKTYIFQPSGDGRFIGNVSVKGTLNDDVHIFRSVLV